MSFLHLVTVPERAPDFTLTIHNGKSYKGWLFEDCALFIEPGFGLSVPLSRLQQWQDDRSSGGPLRHVQDAFPDMPAAFREYLITGTTPAQWEEMFGKPGDASIPWSLPDDTPAAEPERVPPEGLEALELKVFAQAAAEGLSQPVWAHNSSGAPTLIDMDDGECYEVVVALRKIE